MRIIIGYIFLALVLMSNIRHVEAAQEAEKTQTPFVLAGEPDRINLFVDSLKKLIILDGPRDLNRWMGFMNSLAKEQDQQYQRDMGASDFIRIKGEPKKFRETWIVGALAFLFLLLGLIRLLFPSELRLVIQAYFNAMALNQMSKEDNLLTTWPSFFLYLLSGFSVGLFIYLMLLPGQWIYLSEKGWENYLIISLLVLGLFGLKVLFLRLTGLFFEIQKIIRQYVLVLSLGYFIVGFISLPLGLSLAFLPHYHASWLIPASIFLITLVLVFRILKFLAGLLYNYRFSKFYLFVYLCTLEIAPILILLKILFR